MYANCERRGSVKELTLLELFLSVLSCSSNTTKHNRKLVMMRRPTRFWLGGAFFFFDCALIFCAMYRLTFVARAASSSPTIRRNGKIFKVKIFIDFCAIPWLSNRVCYCGKPSHQWRRTTNHLRTLANNHIRTNLLLNPDTAENRWKNNNNKDCEIIFSDHKLSLGLSAVGVLIEAFAAAYRWV